MLWRKRGLVHSKLQHDDSCNHRSCFVAEYKKDARCHVKHCNYAFVPFMTSIVFTLTVQNYIHRYSKHLLI